jgi:predicted ATPase
MALHSGAAEQRAGDYFGPTLNRLARLLAAGHGEQVLLSRATAELVRDQLPEGLTLRDLGPHRLKDLTRPEQIFQLVALDLPSEFPPLWTLDARRHNLPAQPTPLIGREQEIAAVGALLRRDSGGGNGADVRLVTLLGPGGIGKTRLSLQVAAELLDAFPDGVWLVELAPLADPALVPRAVATALGLGEEPGRPLLARLIEYLRTRECLLILDNCEHLVDASAQLAEALLREGATVQLLTTSREALGIAGETTVQVPPLSIPDAQPSPSDGALLRYEAVRLFVDRAAAALPSFTITTDNAAAIAQICRRLDGIPLALELAAARAAVLRVEQIAARLDDAFRLLAGGSRTALPRQQTLRASMDWSYSLLADVERVLLRRLAVFAGGWTLDAAEQVTSENVMRDANHQTDRPALAAADVLDMLTQLTNKSLVIAEREQGKEARYRMLEPIRQYAYEKLLAAGESEEVRDRHLTYYRDLAEQAELTGAQHVAWLSRLAVEMDNVRAALDWALERDIQSGLRLASAIWRFCFRYGYIGEHSERLMRLLAHPDAVSRTWVRAKALAAAARLLAWADLSPGHPLAEESLAIYRELGDRRGEAFSLLTVGMIPSWTEDPALGRALVLESLALCRSLGDMQGIADALVTLGAYLDTNEYTRARGYLEESLALYRERGDTLGMADALEGLGGLATWHSDFMHARAWLDESLALQRPLGGWNSPDTLLSLGYLALNQGEYARARAYLEESLAKSQDAGNTMLGRWVFVQLGYVALREGDEPQARAIFEEAQRRFQKAGKTIGGVYALEGLASLAARQGQAARAVRLFAWTDGTRASIGDSRLPVEQANVDRDLAALRTQLDDAALAAAWAEGRALTLEQAVAEALDH